ncbi:MAG: DUF2892 domain-containing protein [Nitrospirota bacterium]|nr:DUF2892 domain-containing protein [Nitrospirota bacterium]
MTVNEALRAMAGTFLLISLALAHYHNPNWVWFTAFIGVNLLQSAFTKWCPAMAIFRWMGLPDAKADCGTGDCR